MPNTLSDRLNALRAKGIAALVRHARRPGAFGAADEHKRYWFCANEARYAQAEGNAVFAATLLPATGLPAPAGEGIPVLPAGTRWAVDENGEGTITLTVNIAAAEGVTARVRPAVGAAFNPTVTVEPTRLTTTFPAAQDGVYLVLLLTEGAVLAEVLVPVTRSLFRALREDSRAAGYAFRPSLPVAPSEDHQLRLALLVCAESAAQTGQRPLALSLLADAAAVRQAPVPTALYPYRG